MREPTELLDFLRQSLSYLQPTELPDFLRQSLSFLQPIELLDFLRQSLSFLHSTQDNDVQATSVFIVYYKIFCSLRNRT